MKKKLLLCINFLVVIVVVFSLSSCSNNSPTVSDNQTTNTNEINVGAFKFDIPDYYDSEPKSKIEESDVVSYAFMKPEFEDWCQLMFTKVELDGEFTPDRKKSILNTTLNRLFENVSITEGEYIYFTGDRTGVAMEGVGDVVYSAKTNEVVTVIHYHRKDSEYDYNSDFPDIIESTTVDEEKGTYNSPAKSSSSGEDTNNSKDYNLGNYDYDDDGEVDDNEFQDAVNDYMDDNGY